MGRDGARSLRSYHCRGSGGMTVRNLVSFADVFAK